MMADAVRFKIDGKTYDTATVDDISLRDIVLFNGQAADMGLHATWADVERISQEMAELTAADDSHPDSLLMFAVTVWAARRIAGDDVTLDEALDVPMSKIEVLEGRKVPKDRQPKKGTKSKSPRPRTGVRETSAEDSGTDDGSTTPPTSSVLSENA